MINERIAETEENSEISDRRATVTRNYNIDLPTYIKNQKNNLLSSSKNFSMKGASNHHHSYKIMNLNIKNQNNFLLSPSNILKDAIKVKNVHNEIVLENNPNSIRNIPKMIDGFTEIIVKRPSTSKWHHSTISNLSNQFNSSLSKNENDKYSNKITNKINNHYFNHYIDMQFKSTNVIKNSTNKKAINLANKDDSGYQITSTKNDKFSVENEKVKTVKIYLFYLDSQYKKSLSECSD